MELAFAINVHVEQGNSDSRELAALGAWQSIWTKLERLVVELRDQLGSHLRDNALAASVTSTNGDRVAGLLSIGRARRRIECALRCEPPSDDEAHLRELFGGDTPLARIFVLRETDGRPLLESILVVDPARSVWIATEPAIGPVSLADDAALEELFWSLVADLG